MAFRLAGQASQGLHRYLWMHYVFSLKDALYFFFIKRRRLFEILTPVDYLPAGRWEIRGIIVFNESLKSKINLMKNLCLLIFTLSSLHIPAQNKLPVIKFTSAITPDIIKVAGDYYDHFFNIKGEKISETESTIEYKSKILPQGALESTITQIKNLQNVYSWHAIMMNTDDHDKAVAKYKQIYHQLNGANFAMNDGKTCKIKGLYDAPDEDRSFASSILEPDTKEKYLQRLKIEIALNYNMPEWSVKILVYEKESDEDIRPTQGTAQ
jgi:hypothetical protein